MTHDNPGMGLGKTIFLTAISAGVFAFTIEWYASWRESKKVISREHEELMKAHQRIAELEALVKLNAQRPRVIGP